MPSALAAFAALSMMLGSARAAFLAYHITEIGATGGFSSVGTALNDHGHVVGTIYTETGDLAFFYDGTQQILEMSAGGTRSKALDINNDGVIVGTVDSYNEDNSLNWSRAFRYDGTMHELGPLAAINSEASGINTLGEITGSAYIQSVWNIFSYDGTLHPLGSPSAVNSAHAINDVGQIVGEYSDAENFTTMAFLYDGSFHDLGTLGGSRSYARDINDLGQIVGYAHLDDETPHAYLYDGTMHDLGFEGSAEAINNQGQIVGNAFDFGAFIYDGANGLADLNSLIDPALGWDLAIAYDINEHGQITGLGVINGKARAFLMTPVPEPSTAILSAAGLSALAAWASRRRNKKTR